MEAVYVLGRIDGLQHAPAIDVSGQRKLNEDAINGIVIIEPADQIQQYGFIDIAWQQELLRLDAYGLSLFGFGLHVNRTCRVFADQHHGQCRCDVVLGLEQRHLSRNASAKDLSDGFSVDSDSTHDYI